MNISRSWLLLAIALIVAVVISVFLFSNKKRTPLVEKIDQSGIKLLDSFKFRPLTNIQYERSPERVQKGKYLAEGILMCFTCHSPRNQNAPGKPLDEAKKGSGGTIVYEDSTSFIVAPNITSDKETGAGTWTDDMFARAIREGVGHDGRALSWQMPYNIFRELSDEDLASVIVYLRTLPPIHNVVPRTRITAMERSETQKYLRPILKPVPERDVSTKVKRGQYLVRIGECIGCHTSHSEYNPGIFGGGNHVTRYQSTAFSANLTPDSSGIQYGEEGFKFVLRTGKGGTLSPAMPWIAFKNLNDDDIKAIYSYLRSLPPSHHYVNNQDPPTHCDICGMEHGLGDMNKRRRPAGIKMDPGLYQQFVGTYREDEWQSTYIVSLKGSTLIAKGWDKGPEYELVPQSELSFAGEGLPIPFSFVKDKNGNVTQIVEATDYGRTFKKVDTAVAR